MCNVSKVVIHDRWALDLKLSRQVITIIIIIMITMIIMISVLLNY